MVGQNDEASDDAINHSTTHPTETADLFATDNNKHDDVPNGSPTMDQQESYFGTHQTPLVTSSLGEPTSSRNLPSVREPVVGFLENPVSNSPQQSWSASAGEPDYESHDHHPAPGHFPHHPSPPGLVQNAGNAPQNSGSLSSTSWETSVSLDPPPPAASIGHEAPEFVPPPSGIANLPSLNLQNGLVSPFMSQNGLIASTPLLNTSLVHAGPSLALQDPEYSGDEEDMESNHDDYDYPDDELEDENYGNLIGNFDLSGFSGDRLFRVPSPFDSEGSDDSPSDTNDREMFYVTDDELSLCDPNEYYSSLASEHGRSHFENFIAGNEPQPLSFADFGHGPTTTGDEDDVDDYAAVSGSIQTESMDSYFLHPSSTLFFPLNSRALGMAHEIIRHDLENARISGDSTGPLTNAPASPAPSTSYLHSDLLMLQSAARFIARFSISPSPSRGIFIICGGQDVLFVNDTKIALLSGLNVPEVLCSDDEYTAAPPRFVFASSLPWVESSRPFPDTIPQRQVAQPRRALLSLDDYEDLHMDSEYSIFYVPPALVLEHFSATVASLLLATLLAPWEGIAYIANGTEIPAFERNLPVDMFIKQWLIRSRIPPAQLGILARPSVPLVEEAASEVSYWPRPQKISRPDDHQFKSYDIQNIPWWSKLKVHRSDARALRDRWYRPYRNLTGAPHGYSAQLPQSEEFFKAKTMYTKYKASMSHFQLRNLMCVTASNTIQYVRKSRVYTATPFHNHHSCLMDLSNPDKSSGFLEPVKISTMKAKHGITIVGGFSGEYAMRGNVTGHDTTYGYVTIDPNGITNHMDIVKNRTSNNPQAVIASNDLHIRVLDCETNTFVQKQKFAQAINCTDTSPDGRLRLIIGDAKDAWVIDSDTGKPVQPLTGHRDFGFACAWSPDMLHLATANQDGIVNIWDARMWRVLQFIESDIAGYRSLRFSPIGGGPRTLLMCEPADRIAIVNAQTYQTRQVHDFFGEIGGADYTPDGGRIWVANMDNKFGGMMEFDRCQWGQQFGIGHTKRRQIEERLDTYYPDLPNEWLPEADLDDDVRCVLGPGERRTRFRRLLGSKEHADLYDL
ncbi:hypothetical protein FQN55_000994 [Onygenales sp. PD_40]|nr:hypothetical protein FQN55_000994 [Onygenales sp. PD_40]KAK2798582.1 hypothetical protein FQN51_007602 [Onygenales sp. PD_10]